MDIDRLLEFVRALEHEGVEYAVFGAVALGLHGLVRVVTPSTLYRMKRATVREKDRMDAEALRRTFDLEDE